MSIKNGDMVENEKNFNDKYNNNISHGNFSKLAHNWYSINQFPSVPEYNNQMIYLMCK